MVVAAREKVYQGCGNHSVKCRCLSFELSLGRALHYGAFLYILQLTLYAMFGTAPVPRLSRLKSVCHIQTW